MYYEEHEHDKLDRDDNMFTGISYKAGGSREPVLRAIPWPYIQLQRLHEARMM